MNERYIPNRLTQDLAIQQVGDETLVYDERRHMAFCLNRVAAAVWQECNGELDASQIADRLTVKLAHPISREVVDFALAQLSRDGLLQIPAAPAPVAALSRRSLMARAGAGAVMMLPVVAAIMAPRAAQAYNGGVDLPLDDPSHEIPADPGEPVGSSHSGGGSSPLFPEDPK
jgi:hypothetical protein